MFIGKGNHLVNCIANVFACAFLQGFLYLFAPSLDIVENVIIVHYLVAIGCAIAIAGEIIVAKMKLEKKDTVDRVRRRFFALSIIWFVLVVVAFNFLVHRHL